MPHRQHPEQKKRTYHLIMHQIIIKTWRCDPGTKKNWSPKVKKSIFEILRNNEKCALNLFPTQKTNNFKLWITHTHTHRVHTVWDILLFLVFITTIL